MFMGEYQHSIDVKGRIIIPSKFREQLGVNYVLAKGFDECLFAYPLKAWEKLNEQLSNAPFTNSEMRSFARFFFAGAAEAEVDKQGRSLVPPNMREHAHLNKDIVIIGVQERFEIWDKEHWEAYRDASAGSFEENAEKLNGFIYGL